MTAERNDIIDLFRGVVIVDMMALHFVGFFPEAVARIVDVFDYAIEGFVLLAGFMIGRYYLLRFKQDRSGVSKRLLLRAVRIVVIQYLLIITVSIPFHAYFYFPTASEVISFALNSFLFLNQVPIIHILPTFIPLLMASPLILLLLVGERNRWLIAISASLFLIGLSNPYVFTIGQKTIFPVVLWQVYFVAGCVIGKRSIGSRKVAPQKLLLFASLFFGICLLMKYGGYFEVIRSIKAGHNIYPKKFPLNLYGLTYGASLLFFVYAVFANLKERLQKGRKILDTLQLLGRHSLAVFVFHVYLIYGIRVMTMSGASVVAVCAAVGVSLYAIYFAALTIDRQCKAGNLPGAYRWLFT